ncbi:MAG: DUF711 family protein [Anaerolineae bacterium]|nr:DUF711 family protein [Anaerolineae bacterium]
MRIRSITCLVNATGDAIEAAGRLAGEARTAFEETGLAVQTTRLATQPLSLLGGDPVQRARELWARCTAASMDYLSVGPVLADTPGADLSPIAQIPELIRAADAVFCGVLVAQHGRGINLAAIRRTAWAIRDIAHTTDLGFGNLRLAALANVGPGAPFFPAAYHDGGPPAVAIATESADLAVTAFSQAGSLDEARGRLVGAVEATAGRICSLIGPLAERHGFRFAGIDFSPAPFPEQARSIAQAVERLGVDRFGAAGTLFTASFITDCLRRSTYPRCGFNGLMLPMLEDATLAERSRDGLFTVNDLLLYSAVCGTGLDTVPLPGDVSEDELSGILLDMAALALRLDKPLTARLMPVPGAQAGDMTAFDFDYFANGRVLAVKRLGSPGLFRRADWLAI